MQTSLSAEFQNTAPGRQAEKILRACVHCGLCNATCPTYELLGDERDSPRGRIYQMKQLFEGHAVSRSLRLHLDRCLRCRACETTCPSGVQYNTLLELSHATLDRKLPRSLGDRMRRRALGRFIANGTGFARLLRLGWRCRRLLPTAVRRWLPPQPSPQPNLNPAPAGTKWPPRRHARKMIALAGCVQSAATPNTNLAAARVLDRLGISLFEVGAARCCGAAQLHTGGHTGGEPAGLAAARALIDQWLPHLQSGAEAIVMTASGCGLTIKEYPQWFANEPAYREKARQISAKTLDLSEVVARELPHDYAPARRQESPRKVAFHAPCTLQHGQRTRGVVEAMLTRGGYTLCEVRDAHLCCGAAGTYSILQPKLAAQLRQNKQAALAASGAQVVCTANVGCQMHLGMNFTQGTNSTQSVVHWIELLERVLPPQINTNANG